MNSNNILKTNPKKYSVHTEDHWDFYKNPSVRPLIGEFDTYEEAVMFAKKWIENNIDTLESDPACCFIVPEPDGKHFDSHDYEKELRK